MKLRKSKAGWNVYDNGELMGVVSIETLETDFIHWMKYFRNQGLEQGQRQGYFDRIQEEHQKSSLGIVMALQDIARGSDCFWGTGHVQDALRDMEQARDEDV